MNITTFSVLTRRKHRTNLILETSLAQDLQTSHKNLPGNAASKKEMKKITANRHVRSNFGKFFNTIAGAGFFQTTPVPRKFFNKKLSWEELKIVIRVQKYYLDAEKLFYSPCGVCNKTRFGGKSGFGLTAVWFETGCLNCR